MTVLTPSPNPEDPHQKPFPSLTLSPLHLPPSSVTPIRQRIEPFWDSINNSLEYGCCSTCNARVFNLFGGGRIVLLLDAWTSSTPIPVRCRRCTFTVPDPRKAPVLPVDIILAIITNWLLWGLRESGRVPKRRLPVFPIPPQVQAGAGARGGGGGGVAWLRGRFFGYENGSRGEEAVRVGCWWREREFSLGETRF